MRPVRIAPAETVLRHGPGGVLHMQSPVPLGPYPVRTTVGSQLLDILVEIDFVAYKGQ